MIKRVSVAESSDSVFTRDFQLEEFHAELRNMPYIVLRE